MNRLEPRIDGFYENTQNTPMAKSRPKFLNPHFNTSNSLFVQENEDLEQRLYSKYEKLNQDTVPTDDPYPYWFKEKINTLLDLGSIQQNQLRYPVVAEIPSNIIKTQTSLNTPTAVTNVDVNSLRLLIQSLAPPKGS